MKDAPGTGRAIGPAEIIVCFSDLLPAPVKLHRKFELVLNYLRAVDRDVAYFCYYIEWNLRSGDIDVTFTFPTTLDRWLRISFWDIALGLVRSESGEKTRGQRLLEQACSRIQSTPLDSPMFPRAVSVSIESLGEAHRSADIDFVFLDYGPTLEFSVDRNQLREAFSFIDTEEPDPTASSSLSVLERMSEGLRIAHIGLGWRREVRRRKVYLMGRLDELVEKAVRCGAGPLIGHHATELGLLAEAAGDRTSHLVVDEADGRVVRVGFELNFDVARAGGFAELATGTKLWKNAVGSDVRACAEVLLRLGEVSRPLDDGNRGCLRVSHLKLSFDGSGEPEWKAYLCFQGFLGFPSVAPIKDDQGQV